MVCGRDIADIAHQKSCAAVLSSILERTMLSLLVDCHRQSNRERASYIPPLPATPSRFPSINPVNKLRISIRRERLRVNAFHRQIIYGRSEPSILILQQRTEIHVEFAFPGIVRSFGRIVHHDRIVVEKPAWLVVILIFGEPYELVAYEADVVGEIKVLAQASMQRSDGLGWILGFGIFKGLFVAIEVGAVELDVEAAWNYQV